MKRILNEEFLYEGNSYFIKNINGTVEFPLCNFCPLNKPAHLIDCIPIEILECYGRCEIVKKWLDLY